MKRRHFIGATAAGLSATLWPAFILEAFGEAPACEKDSRPAASASVVEVSAAFRRARRAGKPLLVFVIPADDGAKYNRGQAFGELLNFGEDGDLAPLAGVEVVCATMADLKKLVPVAGEGEPLFVVVKTDKVPVVAAQLDAALPAYGRMGRGPAGIGGERQDEDEIAARRIAALGALLRKGLGAAPDGVAARAASVRARLVKKPPPGAHWATSSGCGADVEGVESNVMIGCGMGHVPAKSQRFLYFFAVDRQGD